MGLPCSLDWGGDSVYLNVTAKNRSITCTIFHWVGVKDVGKGRMANTSQNMEMETATSEMEANVKEQNVLWLRSPDDLHLTGTLNCRSSHKELVPQQGGGGEGERGVCPRH